MNSHIDQELADEFAIGALDEPSAAAVTEHIASCESCARVVSESDRVAAALLLGVPRNAPPPELRQKVFRKAGIERPASVVWGARIATAGAGIAAIVVAIASFVGMLSVRGDIDSLQDENARLDGELRQVQSQEVEIAALTLKLDDQARESAELRSAARLDRDLFFALLSPDSDKADVYSVDPTSSAIGRVIWDPDQSRIWFVASRLPKLSGGDAYQLWVDADGTFVSLGTFNADESGFARFQALVPQGVDGYDNAVVTIEPGPVSQRSGPAVLVADLSSFRP